LPALRYEPRIALDGGADGLRLIERLLDQARNRLPVGGCLLMEIEAGQGASLPSLADRFFPQATFSVTKDLAGFDRLAMIEK
jgi:release factor glutamine methyltransferase